MGSFGLKMQKDKAAELNAEICHRCLGSSTFSCPPQNPDSHYV